MPRDLSGNYTLPAGNPVSDGSVIETSWANPTMSDIAAQLNNVFTRDGLLGPLGPLLVVDGTAGAPGLGWNVAPTTGFYRSAATGAVGLSIGAAPVQAWSATGTTIAGTLSGVTDLTTTGNTVLGNAQGDTLNVAAGAIAVGATGGVTMASPASGSSLVVNTSLATLAVSVVGTGNQLTQGFSVANTNAGNAAGAYLYAESDTTSLIFAAYAGAHATFPAAARIFTNTAQALSLGTNSIDRMRIDTAGNLGIGITPAFRLDVQGSTGAGTVAKFKADNATQMLVRFADAVSETGYIGSGEAVFAGILRSDFGIAANVGALVLGSANVERMRIDVAGNVGIGTASALGRLHVENFGGTASIILGSSPTRYGFFTWLEVDSVFRIATDGAFPIRFDTQGDERMRIDVAGNVGIGTAGPLMRLQIRSYGGFDGNPNQLLLRHNTYYTDTTRRIADGASSNIEFLTTDGSITFLNGTVGLANEAVTLIERMRIDAAGSVIIANLAGTGNRQVMVDANGRLYAA